MSLIERSNLPPGPVAAVEVGTVGYLTSRPILDLTGLTSVNPEFLSGIHLDRFFAHPPPLVIFHIPIWGMERALYQDPRFRYIYGQGIEIPTPYLPLQYFVAQRTAQDLTEANLQTYISANFQVFTRTSAEQNSQRPTGKAECVLDAINEFPKGERRFPINRLSLLSIRGWGVDRTAPGIDTEVQLQLLGESGDSFSATASRSPRPDVAKALAHPDYLMAGFVGEYDVQPLKPGIYFLKIFLRRGDSTLGI
jgi:hypothetical protein